MKKITLVMVLILLSVSTDRSWANTTNEPIKKLLVDYINKMNALTQGTQKEDVLRLFDEKYVGNTVYVNLSGALVRKNYEKKDISNQLDDIIGDNNYKFKLTLDKVVFQSQKERAGTISAVVVFESFIDKRLAEKGTMLMDLVAIRVNGGWKIVQNNMVRVSEAKDIGDCVCYMYGKGSTKFVTEVYFPSGLEYSQEFDAFQVTSKEGKRIIKSDNNEFYWSRDTGKLTFKGDQLGKAENAKKAIEFVLKDLYKDSCVNIVFN
ncbi:hypothetical protein M0D21_05975 [Aquimarina sp. D1M17]|uniref:hypothetical protein n=1 Tax=Aquimarina acroporae TaxID=2937283 RepID=UPI0020BE2571|nr:hypothetical protein [Aquimarina acroporae]MCK8521103.1 hypothetical protein [Aquimarina acroporae]